MEPQSQKFNLPSLPVFRSSTFASVLRTRALRAATPYRAKSLPLITDSVCVVKKICLVYRLQNDS